MSDFERKKEKEIVDLYRRFELVENNLYKALEWIEDLYGRFESLGELAKKSLKEKKAYRR